MLEITQQKEMAYLDSKGIEKFPCSDLSVIDQLWMKSSGGRFGFSVQQQIYIETGNLLNDQYYEESWEEFCELLGWIKGEKYIMYEGVTFDISAPKGHLPFMFSEVGRVRGQLNLLSLFSRMDW